MRLQCPKCNAVNLIEAADAGTSTICGHCGQVNDLPARRIAPYIVFHDFVIRKVVRRGSDGTEALANQLSLDRPVVLRILDDDLSQNAEYVSVFVKRARLAAKLNHPNLVPIYLVGKEYDLYYLVRAATELQSLRELLARQGRIDTGSAVSIFQQIADGLDYAWRSAKLLHGNLKPASIQISEYGVAALADIGVAHIDLGDEPDKIKGTPQYISPEQILGEQIDNRSDIYSLGAILYQCITGAYPFAGETTIEIFQQHVQAPLRSPREIDPTIPESVCQVIAKMMAKDPSDRYPDCTVLSQDLLLVAQGSPPHFAVSQPPLTVAAVVAQPVAKPVAQPVLADEADEDEAAAASEPEAMDEAEVPEVPAEAAAPEEAEAEAEAEAEPEDAAEEDDEEEAAEAPQAAAATPGKKLIKKKPAMTFGKNVKKKPAGTQIKKIFKKKP